MGDRFFPGPVSSINGAAFRFSKACKTHGALFCGEVPEVNGVAAEGSMRPGVPDAVMMIMVTWLNGGQNLSLGAPQGVNKTASLKNGIDAFGRINCFILIIQYRTVAGPDYQAPIPAPGDRKSAG